MSYDLYLQPRNTTIPPAAFYDWFAARPFYERSDNELHYSCKDTGVYFHFVVNDTKSAIDQPQPADPHDEGTIPLEFNMNYLRPSYFALEAERELTALVRDFDLTVVDLQVDGMAGGEYSPQGFLNGWNAGNAFSYKAIIGQHRAEKGHSMEQEQLTRIWQWNYDRSRLDPDLQKLFVPRICFGLRAGAVVTFAVWPDGIPSHLPPTDYVIIVREDLAPRKLFKHGRDSCWLPWAQVEPLLSKRASAQPDGSLQYKTTWPDPEIEAFIRSLRPARPSVELIPANQVLDKELVEAALQES